MPDYDSLKSNPLPLIILGVLILFAVILVGSSCSIVEPGHAGVRVMLGQVENEALGEGLHFKWPFAEEIHQVDVRRSVSNITAEAASRDMQRVQTTVAINYRARETQSWELFQTVGPDRTSWENVLIYPAVQESVKAVTARYNAEELVTKREEVKGMITDTIRKRADESNSLEIEQVSITDFKFSAAFDNAIESKQVAEQEAARAENEAKRRKIEAESERVVREQQSEANAFEIERRAKAEALAVTRAAEAEAEAIRIRAQAEAEALERLADAARDPALRARFIEKWDGQLPRVIAGGEEGSGIQFFMPIDGEEEDRRSQDNENSSVRPRSQWDVTEEGSPR